MIKRLVAFAVLAFSISGTLGGAASAAPTGPSWGADYFPNVPLVTQDGKTVMFYDDLLKDKKVLIDFMFAKCEDSCPLDTANMARIQKRLGSKVGKDIHMYSITLDPEHDTPEVLKEYAAQYGARPGWLFLTGKRTDIDKIRARFGDSRTKEEHINTVKVGDVAKGLWMKFPLTGDPNYIAAEVRNTFEPGWSKEISLKSIADAPQAEIFGPGQLLFANRCAACHNFGKGAELGPDLKGITDRRERDWIINYLAEPKKMRARKDPIALELAKNYKVLMPNLSLTNRQLGDVMDYLEHISTVPSKPEAPKTVVAPGAAGAEKPTALAHDHQQHDHAGENK